MAFARADWKWGRFQGDITETVMYQNAFSTRNSVENFSIVSFAENGPVLSKETRHCESWQREGGSPTPKRSDIAFLFTLNRPR